MKTLQKIIPKLLILAFFTIITFLTFFIENSIIISYHDPLWNLQSIYKMCNGSLIYKDTNVLITPIFFIIGKIIFQIFSANLLTFNIYGTFIFLIKFIVSYKIFRYLKINKTHSLLYVSLLFLIDIATIPSSANYNELAIVFTLFGILLYIKKYNKKFYNFLQGIIIFLTFFTKQTIGVYYAIGVVLFEFIDIGINAKFFKNQLLKLTSFIPLTLFSLLIMYIKGNLFDFLNMCFGNLLEFGQSNFKFNSNYIGYFFGSFIIIFATIFIIIKVSTVSDEFKTNLKFLLCLCIPLSLNVLPLINAYHVTMSFYYYLILFTYLIDVAFINELFSSKKSTYCIVLIVFLIFLAIFLKATFSYIEIRTSTTVYDKNHPFYGNPVKKTDITQTELIQDYIKRKKEQGTSVIIINYDAVRYNLPLGINNNEFDLLLAGNLGFKGISKTIEKIKNMHNTEFLMFTDEDDCFYQEPKEIRQYIIDNFEKSGDLFNYSIYIKE